MSLAQPEGRLVAGFNQFCKLVRRGETLKVYLASDADGFFASGVMNELASHPEVALDTSLDSRSLAEMANVEVPTAVLTVVA